MAKIALIAPISRFNGYRGFSISHPGLVSIGTILKENGHS